MINGIEPNTLWSLGSQWLLSLFSPILMQVRKAAQEAVMALLKKPPGDMQHHPASATTAKFCVQQIEEHGGKGDSLIEQYFLF